MNCEKIGIGRKTLGRAARVALALLAASVEALAEEHAAPPAESAKTELSDLGFSNFFSEGWGEAWTRRSRGNGTPNMSLLRVQGNFLAQLARTDYALQENLAESPTRRVSSLATTVEYAFNRRLMLAVLGNYRWIDARRGEDLDGAAGGAFARFQLVDKAADSLAATLRVAIPNRDTGERATTTSLALAGWRDLAPLGLNRMGLYYHVQEETLAGPVASGSRRNDMTYALSLAKTWTAPDSLFGNATTFLESYAKSDLDGNQAGHTFATITPGLRATFARRHIVMAGVEFPLTHPQPFAETVRLTYIFNF